jgi:hypothetical protein
LSGLKFSKLCCLGDWPAHVRFQLTPKTEAIGFMLRNLSPQFSFAPHTEPDEGNWPTPIFRELRPAKWGLGLKLHSSNPETLMSALGQKRTSD